MPLTLNSRGRDLRDFGGLQGLNFGSGDGLPKVDHFLESSSLRIIRGKGDKLAPQNSGYLFGGSNNKGCSILRPILGSP